MYTKDQIKAQLDEMDIKHSDTVLIHTSLRSLGEVEGGANGLIDMFCEYLSDGLFLVPTHTWDSVTPENPVYDVRSAVPCIGAVLCAAAMRSDGVRSLHPTHSVWAKGKGAEDFVRGEEAAQSPAPVGFLWSRLGDVGAKILLIGVKNDKNTFIHSLDERFGVPNRLGIPYATTIIDRDGVAHHGVMRAHRCTKSRDVSRSYVNFEQVFTESGAERTGKLGDAEVRIVDAAMATRVFAERWEKAAARRDCDEFEIYYV